MADRKWSQQPIKANPVLTDHVMLLDGNQLCLFSSILTLFIANIQGSDLVADHVAVNYTPAGNKISDHLAAIDGNFTEIDGGTY